MWWAIMLMLLMLRLMWLMSSCGRMRSMMSVEFVGIFTSGRRLVCDSTRHNEANTIWCTATIITSTTIFVTKSAIEQTIQIAAATECIIAAVVYSKTVFINFLRSSFAFITIRLPLHFRSMASINQWRWWWWRSGACWRVCIDNLEVSVDYKNIVLDIVQLFSVLPVAMPSWQTKQTLSLFRKNCLYVRQTPFVYPCYGTEQV